MKYVDIRTGQEVRNRSSIENPVHFQNKTPYADSRLIASEQTSQPERQLCPVESSIHTLQVLWDPFCLICAGLAAILLWVCLICLFPFLLISYIIKIAMFDVTEYWSKKKKLVANKKHLLENWKLKSKHCCTKFGYIWLWEGFTRSRLTATGNKVIGNKEDRRLHARTLDRKDTEIAPIPVEIWWVNMFWICGDVFSMNRPPTCIHIRLQRG